MIEKIENAIKGLKEFEISLNETNVDEFENLKEGIKGVLDENRKIKFDQIEFYTITDNQDQESDDWLPF